MSTTTETTEWAHEDPKVLAYLRRIGTATSAADRAAARGEMDDYLAGPGRGLQRDSAAFARAHMARVDRQAWNIEQPDAARTVPQWKVDQQLHADYRRYAELTDHAGHGENEIDRAAFVRQAGELGEYWTMVAPNDWAAMRELHQWWQAAPERAREFTEAELRHNPDANRHLAAAKDAFDPRVGEYEQWREMHNRISEISAEKYLADTDEQIDAIQARIDAVHGDATAWPASWREFEEDAITDPEFWREQSERTGERYKELTVGVPAAEEAEQEQEAEGEEIELEESSWGA